MNKIGNGMTPQQIAYIVQAADDGCGWKWDYPEVSSLIGIGGDFANLIWHLNQGDRITLIAESWDWPQERRLGKRSWERQPGGMGTKLYDVAINPAAPDQPPPDDWSPEKYPRILEE